MSSDISARNEIPNASLKEGGGNMGWLGRLVDRTAKLLLSFSIIRVPARWLANSRFAWSFVSRTDRVRANRLRDRVKTGEIPQHVSIIMDGNRRFAEKEGIESSTGHRYGKQKLEEVMDWVLDLDIPYLTVYALSIENVTSRTGKSSRFCLISTSKVCESSLRTSEYIRIVYRFVSQDTKNCYHHEYLRRLKRQKWERQNMTDVCSQSVLPMVHGRNSESCS